MHTAADTAAAVDIACSHLTQEAASMQQKGHSHTHSSGLSTMQIGMSFAELSSTAPFLVG
jgi:hypothetical protein